MARDKEPVSGSVPGPLLIAARLCNFRNGEHHLDNRNHLDWLRNTLVPKLQASPNPWIDIYAYASARGITTGYDNAALSRRRRDEVKSFIASLAPKARFVQQEGRGSSMSPRVTNDEGFWRAVDIYAYGGPPPGKATDPTPPRPRPKVVPEAESPQWFVTNLNLTGGSLVPGLGVGGHTGSITFVRPGRETVSPNIEFAGVGIGISLGIPNLDAHWSKLMVQLANNGAASHAALPSGTIGMVFPMRGATKIGATEFSGPCAVQYLSANAAAGGYGSLAIWFGAETSRPDRVIPTARGVALLSTAGLGVSLNLGASLLIAVGKIGSS